MRSVTGFGFSERALSESARTGVGGKQLRKAAGRIKWTGGGKVHRQQEVLRSCSRITSLTRDSQCNPRVQVDEDRFLSMQEELTTLKQSVGERDQKLRECASACSAAQSQPRPCRAHR